MNIPLMARKIKVETNLRCDFDNGIIPVGKYATHVKDGKAPGIYHGRPCHDSAVATREKIEKEQDKDIGL